MSDIVVFHSDSHALTFTDKKGSERAISAEGALFKGGAALAALKDAAIDSAIAKAANGRYRAASDILCAAFPSVGKAAENLIGAPWANKSTMCTLLSAIRRAEEPARGWTKRQVVARMLASALGNIPALKVEAAEPVTIEA